MRPLFALLAALALTLGTMYPRVGAQSPSYPNDPRYPQQWSLHSSGNTPASRVNMHVEEAWASTRCSPSIVVADLDTGVDDTHPDLKPKLVPGVTFVAGTLTTADDNGHGTGTAGVIAAVTNNAEGIAGICADGKLMPVKVADAGGHVISENVAGGIRWAVNHGARVLNLSLSTEDTPALRGAVAYAYNHGVVVVAATVSGSAVYPADYPHVLAVAGTGKDGLPIDTGNKTAPNLVLAPSEDILTTTRGGGYAPFCTCVSIAAPQVAGIAALLLSIRPDLTVDGVLESIRRGAYPLPGQTGVDPVRGWGLINAERAISIVRSLAPGTPSETPGPTDTPGPVMTPPPALTLTAGLKHGRVATGGMQTIRVRTLPRLSVSVHTVYNDFTSVYHRGTANSGGSYAYTWKVKKIKGRVDITVTVTRGTETAFVKRHFRIG